LLFVISIFEGLYLSQTFKGNSDNSLSPPTRERAGVRGFELEKHQPPHPAPLLLSGGEGENLSSA
jgi:hypothetical protein